MRRPRFSPRLVTEGIPLGTTLGLCVATHGLTISPRAAPVHLWDEAYIAAFALRMVRGEMLPYVDAVSHRGPLLYWAAAWFGKVFDPTTFTPVRMLALAATLVTVVATYATAARAGWPTAGTIAAMAIGATHLVDLGADGIGLNGELLLNAFVLIGFALLTDALGPGAETRSPRRRRAGLALAGASVALGALSKQVGLVTLLPFAVWTFAAAGRDPEGDAGRPFGRAVRDLAWLAAGFVLPFALVVARYAAAGELATFYYYFVRYNAEVYMAPVHGDVLWRGIGQFLSQHVVLLGLLFPALGATVLLVAGRAWRGDGWLAALREHGFRVAVALATLLTLLTSNATLRGFSHYFVQVIPWAALLFGTLVEDAANHALPSGLSPARRWARDGSLLLVPCLLLGITGALRLQELRKDRAAGRLSDIPFPDVCAQVREVVPPDGTLFVWGFAPSLYLSCGRAPASRYVYTTFVAGVVPWHEASFRDENARAAPGSRAILVDELERARPPLILDAGDGTLMRRRMTRYRELRRYLRKAYCTAPPIRDTLVYRRKNAEGVCPAGTDPLP